MEDRQVGGKRTFSFDKKVYEIQEILLNPEFSMVWSWTTGICPHCKNKIENKVKHTFYRIEILIPDNIKLKDVSVNDIIVMGDAMDNRRMIIPKENYKDILPKSKLFKHLGV
jgi:hypothetical protein